MSAIDERARQDWRRVEAALEVGCERWAITLVLVVVAFREITSDWLLGGALAVIGIFHVWKIKRLDAAQSQPIVNARPRDTVRTTHSAATEAALQQFATEPGTTSRERPRTTSTTDTRPRPAERKIVQPKISRA